MATGGNRQKRAGRGLDFSEQVAQNLVDNRPMFVRYLRCTECLPYVIGVIEGFDSVFQSKLRQTANKCGQEEANEMFLQKLEACKDSGKWKTFVNTLQTLEYEMLAKLLTGVPVSKDRENYVKLAELLTSVIIDKLNPIELLPHLITERCINKRDRQNVECAVREKGCIEGTELLLSRITRLRDDWFRGLMVSLMRTPGKTELMRELDPDFTEKLLIEAAADYDSNKELSTGLSALAIGPGSPEGDTDSCAVKSPDTTSPSSNHAITFSDSPPVKLLPKKELTLLDYQNELYSAVPKDKNTLILAPRNSGKGFVAMKLVQDNLSNGAKPAGQVVYLVAELTKVEQVRGRCQEYLGYRPASSLTISQEAPIVVMRAKDFHHGLKRRSVAINDFSLLIMELDVHYFQEKRHVYKRIMSYYHELRRCPQTDKPMPRIVVLSSSICGVPPLEDLYCTATETCAEFDIQITSMVQENLKSLRESVSMPAVERIPLSDRSDGAFTQAIEELMSRIESAMTKKHESLIALPGDDAVKKMSELINPPIGRTSVKYKTWLTTNQTTLGDISKRLNYRPANFFWNCINLLQFYQNALYISAECRSSDALKYTQMKIQMESSRKLKDYPDQPIVALLDDWKEKAVTLKEMCTNGTESPIIQAVEQKLVDIYQGNREKWVAVLVKYPAAAYSILQYLRQSSGLKGLTIQGAWIHSKDSTRLRESDFDILVTTWSVLSFHLQWALTDWDCVIRTDCPGYNMVTWRHAAQSTRQPRSQFSMQGNVELMDPVDLFFESSIEYVTMEIVRLQREANDEYQEFITNVHTANEQRESWSMSNPEIAEPYAETDVNFVCHWCGTFVCNQTYIRKLDDLWLGLDPRLIHRVNTVRHPAQLVFNRGYTKLGRIVCKNCGGKWGILVYVLRNPHFAFAKEGLDILVNESLLPYCSSWNRAGVGIHLFEYERDLLRCLPTTFCVDGESISDLLKRLPKPEENEVRD